MAVTEKDKGTMPGPDGRKNISPSEEGRTPEVPSKVSPEEAPRSYSQKELDNSVHIATSALGREHKSALETLTEERDGLRLETTTAKSQIEGIQSERDTLQSEIEELTSDNPKQFDLIKKEKQLREQQSEHRANLHTLESEKLAHGKTVKLAEETLRETTIWKISSEYEGSDPVKLKELCDIGNVSSEEQINKVASMLWPKKEGEALTLYSGATEGGLGNFTKEQIGDRAFWKEHREAILEAQKAGRLK